MLEVCFVLKYAKFIADLQSNKSVLNPTWNVFWSVLKEVGQKAILAMNWLVAALFPSPDSTEDLARGAGDTADVRIYCIYTVVRDLLATCIDLCE